METANQHCQRGGTNPLDELPEPEETTEMFAGKQMTKPEFIAWLNSVIQPTFGTFVEDEHENGILYLKIPFQEDDNE